MPFILYKKWFANFNDNVMKQRNTSLRRAFVMTALLTLVSLFDTQAQFAANSVLAEGSWYKIGITEAGIYKIDAQWLRDAGISTASLNPNHLRIYGNGAGMLPQPNASPRIDDLEENAILRVGAQDAQFDAQDYILFYAQGPHEWKLENNESILKQQQNIYADTAYYYLNISNNPGLEIASQASLTGATFTADYFDEAIHHEKDLQSIIQSGRVWYGETFGFQNVHDFRFDTQGLVPNSQITLNAAVMARANQTSNFQISTSTGQLIGEQSILPVSNQTYDFKGRDAENTFQFSASLLSNPNQMDIRLTYLANGNNGTGYLNYLNINYQRALRLYGTQTVFQNLESRQHSHSRFVVAGASTDTKVWDISNPLRPRLQESTVSGGQLSFTAATAGTLRQFVLWQGADFPKPIRLHAVSRQNLHALTVPNLLIVTHPVFRAQAQRLADFRESHDGLSVAVVSTEEIYNEFSSGKRDLTAIRDFVRMLYQRDAQTLKYLLLFGDASYDYKDRIAGNANWVPVYESRQSLHPIFSYSSDDYFGFLEDNEGEWAESSAGDHTLEIGIGRLPVNNNAEARTIVDKLIHYAQSPQTLGKWRNQVTFVADDGDSNTHQRDAERLTEILENQYEHVKITKLYLDAFEQISTPNGELCPDMTQAINQNIEEGTLITNFTGHGAERGWTDEKILETPNIPQWSNAHRLSVFVTATCEFGRYDNPDETSGAEVALLSQNGGGVALITTTRPVFSSTNFLLNEAFYENAFEPIDPQTGEMPRLGDILKYTKNNSLNGSINRNFSMLGDPSMKMAYPKHKAIITHINEQDISTYTDTLKALALIKLNGEIQSASGAALQNYEGLLDIEIFDKRETRQTLGKAANVMDFKVHEHPLFRGRASIENGKFEVSFTLPKDINYQSDFGKIIMYAQPNSGLEDASGGNQKIIIGGSTSNTANDNTPPQISLYLDNEDFVNGDIVGPNVLLMAQIFDNHGINISRAGIGHEITAVLDGDLGKVIILNDYFTQQINSYQYGSIAYPLRGLSPGKHTLSLSVWDTHNNLQKAEIEFWVEPSLQIINFKNYPNPMNAQTNFEFGHNLTGENLKVRAEIFNMQGQLVRQFEENINNSTDSVRLTWNGLDQQGNRVENGIYVYQITLKSSTLGVSASTRQKLLVID